MTSEPRKPMTDDRFQWFCRKELFGYESELMAAVCNRQDEIESLQDQNVKLRALLKEVDEHYLNGLCFKCFAIHPAHEDNCEWDKAVNR